MATKVAFKAMNKYIGLSDDAATEMTDTEVMDSMPKLSRITSARASKICKATAITRLCSTPYVPCTPAPAPPWGRMA